MTVAKPTGKVMSNSFAMLILAEIPGPSRVVSHLRASSSQVTKQSACGSLKKDISIGFGVVFIFKKNLKTEEIAAHQVAKQDAEIRLIVNIKLNSL